MIRAETVNSARVITFARPAKKNALSTELLTSLGRELREAGADVSVRGIVVTGEGTVFASGGDLEELESLVGAPDGAAAVLSMSQEIDAFAACPVPVIAAVNGDVYGGGCELVLACDLALMEEGTTLSFRHARMGLSPAWGGTARLLERVGPAHAAKLLYTAHPVSSDEAERIGLVTEKVSRGTSLARAVALIDEMAKADRGVIEAQKALLRSAVAASFSAVKEHENAAFGKLWAGPAHRAAMARFAATKR